MSRRVSATFTGSGAAWERYATAFLNLVAVPELELRNPTNGAAVVENLWFQQSLTFLLKMW